MSMPIVGQRVYRTHGKTRRIGLITKVLDCRVCVLWADETKSSKFFDYTSLTTVFIRRDATVVKGITSSVQPITAHSPPFGIVTNVFISDKGIECCRVTWDDRTITNQPTQDVMDINWVSPVSPGDVPLTEWLQAFQATHNINIANVKRGQYRCARNHHVPNCLCHDESRPHRGHHILPSCTCNFRITVCKGGALMFSGTHTHHIPGKSHSVAVIMLMTCQ